MNWLRLRQSSRAQVRVAAAEPLGSGGHLRSQNVSTWRRFQALPAALNPVDPPPGDLGSFVAEFVCGGSANAEKTARTGMRIKFRANVPHAWLKEGRNVFAHAHDETMVSADALVIGSPWTRRTRSAAPWSGHRPRLWKLPAFT
jgi:hypothetical protein